MGRTGVEQAVFGTALISAVCCFIVICAYFLSSRMRNEFRDAKHILIVLSVFIMGQCVVVANVDGDKSDVLCKRQAIYFQIFGVSSLVIDSFLAIEASQAFTINISSDSSSNSIQKLNTKTVTFFGIVFPMRFLYYFCIVAIIAVAGVSYICLYENYSPVTGAGYFCYIANQWASFIFSFVPSVMALAILIISYFRILQSVVEIFKTGDSAEENTAVSLNNTTRNRYKSCCHYISSVNETIARLDVNGKRLFYRFAAMPVCYIILLMPEFFRRIIILMSTTQNDDDYLSADALLVAASLCFLSLRGVVVFVIWVASDKNVLADLKDSVAYGEERGTSFSGPVSTTDAPNFLPSIISRPSDLAVSTSGDHNSLAKSELLRGSSYSDSMGSVSLSMNSLNNKRSELK